jgi:hypothetical protein
MQLVTLSGRLESQFGSRLCKINMDVRIPHAFGALTLACEKFVNMQRFHEQKYDVVNMYVTN